MLGAGLLDKRIVIEQRSATRDGIGQPVETWSPIANGNAWASILYPTGLSAIRAGSEVAEVNVSIRLRYREDVTEAHRVRHGSDLFDVQAVLPNKAKGYVDLLCKEVK